MSDSTDTPASPDIPGSWTDPDSEEPYTSTEFEAFNDLLYDGAHTSNTALRYAATDLLITLSAVAENATPGDDAEAYWGRQAVSACRRARRTFERFRRDGTSV